MRDALGPLFEGDRAKAANVMPGGEKNLDGRSGRELGLPLSERLLGVRRRLGHEGMCALTRRTGLQGDPAFGYGRKLGACLATKLGSVHHPSPSGGYPCSSECSACTRTMSLILPPSNGATEKTPVCTDERNAGKSKCGVRAVEVIVPVSMAQYKAIRAYIRAAVCPVTGRRAHRGLQS